MTTPAGFGRLQNPLDGFTTYSSHFILLACRTTEAARAFADDNTNVAKATLEAINSVTRLGQRVPFGDTEDVFLVMDTRRFSQFTVEKMNYEVLINGLTKGESHANLATEISMTVLDGVGITFMNFMQWLMDTQMQTNFDGMVFMIRTVFVGHREDGTTDTVQSVTIPATLFKMDVNLDGTKGIYDLTFMPVFNFSTTQHKRWLSIGKTTNFYSGKSNKLGDLVQSLEDQLNAKSLEFYNTISAVLLKAGKTPQNTDSNRFGRIVRYMITLPDEWANKTCNGSALGNAIEEDWKARLKKQQDNKAKPESKTAETHAVDTFVSVDAGLKITDVLDIMFNQTNGVKDFANADKLSNVNTPVTFYKHLVSISSDKDSFIVHVDVIPFSVPNHVPPSLQANSQSSNRQPSAYEQVGSDGLIYPKNFFALDYVFTGKNVDVLGMDLKIQDLQFLLATNIKVGEGELFNISQKGQKESVEEKELKTRVRTLMSARPYDPIMLPILTDEELKNLNNAIAARDPATRQKNTELQQSYTQNLSRFYAQSPIMQSITLKGNPDIMAKFNISQPVAHINIASATASGTSRTNLNAKQQYRRELEKSLGVNGLETNNDGTFKLKTSLGNQSYVTSPVFALVNIFGPNVALDGLSKETTDTVQGDLFASRVLVDNFYVVMKVVNTIERGVFTQQLDLWSHNVYGSNKLTKEDTQSVKRQ